MPIRLIGMRRDLAIEAGAGRIQIAILETAVTLVDHRQRLGLVGLDRGDRLLEHGLGLGRRPVLGLLGLGGCGESDCTDDEYGDREPTEHASSSSDAGSGIDAPITRPRDPPARAAMAGSSVQGLSPFSR
jgi:hypothetical protein